MTNNYVFKRVKNNDVFTIKLPENPSTGYTWNVETSIGLKIIEDKYESNTSLVGAPGEHIWKIQAIQKGLQFFSAYYGRSWEENYIDEYESIIKVY